MRAKTYQKEIIMYFYERLKLVREANKKTQEQIAEILGITPQEYSLYETGKKKIAMHQMVIVAKYYDLSLDYLAGLIDLPRNLK